VDFVPHIPNEVSELLKSQGLCSSTQQGQNKKSLFQTALCSLINTTSREYFQYWIGKYEGQQYDNITDSVYMAMHNKIQSWSTLEFDCTTMWKNITEQANSSEVLGSLMNLETPLQAVQNSLNNTSCEEECKESKWEIVCGMGLALLNLLPKKMGPIKTTSINAAPINSATGNVCFRVCACVHACM
jgi:hypothetical protein